MEIPNEVPDTIKCFICVTQVDKSTIGIFAIRFTNEPPPNIISVLLCPKCFEEAERNAEITRVLVKARINAMLEREGYDPI